jgi:hypothetical protein
MQNSYLCNELQNERLFCTRHDNGTTSVNEWSNMSYAKNSHFAKSFILNVLILLRKAHILIKILFKSAISIIFRDNNTNVTF